MEDKELRFAKEKLRIFWCGVFCPLTGMVRNGISVINALLGFRPLTGMAMNG